MSITRTSFATRTRTWLLIAGLSALLVGFGALIGGTSGIVLFAGIAVVFNFVMYWFSASLALKSSRARPLAEDEAPQLHQLVRELAGKAQIPMPSLHLIPSEQPNAFATGRNPKHAAVAVTEGLLHHLPADQVRGVIAHELAHIANRDVLVQTIAAMIGAAIAAIANILQFSMLFGGGDDDESPLGLVGALAAIIFAPMAAMILQLAVSRQREYLADATAARYIGEGEPLARALETLKRGTEAIPMRVNPATEALYIANPLSAFKGQGMTALFSTHPPMEERIRRLRALDAASGIHYA
jgi:heat shock protein HtpX